MFEKDDDFCEHCGSMDCKGACLKCPQCDKLSCDCVREAPALAKARADQKRKDQMRETLHQAFMLRIDPPKKKVLSGDADAFAEQLAKKRSKVEVRTRRDGTQYTKKV